MEGMREVKAEVRRTADRAKTERRTKTGRGS